MGLRDILRGRKAPEEPNPFELPKFSAEDFASQTSAGYYLAQKVASRSHYVLTELLEIPNASRADRLAMLETIRGIYNLGRELAEVDAALDAGSHHELSRHLSDAEFFDDMYDHHGYDHDYDYDDHNFGVPFVASTDDAPDDYRAYGHLHNRRAAARELTRNHDGARDWIRDNLPESDQPEFLRLLDRRIEMRAALVKAFVDFSVAGDDISQAAKRARVIQAASQLNRDAGDDARPELEMANAAHTRELAGTLNAGLEEAYRIALKQVPELSELSDPASPFTERSESSLDAGL